MINTMMNKINDETLENVVGGLRVTVNNKASKVSNFRSAPGLDSEVVGQFENGDTFQITGRHVKKDGYDWYETEVAVYGGPRTTWIAGSLIGF